MQGQSSDEIRFTPINEEDLIPFDPDEDDVSAIAALDSRRELLPRNDEYRLEEAGIHQCSHTEECTCLCEHPGCSRYCTAEMDHSEYNEFCECSRGHRWRRWPSNYAEVKTRDGRSFWTHNGFRVDYIPSTFDLFGTWCDEKTAEELLAIFYGKED